MGSPQKSRDEPATEIDGPSTRSTSSSRAVRMSTGTADPARKFRGTSNPIEPRIVTSSSTMSGRGGS
jgi:hypothetical protein